MMPSNPLVQAATRGSTSLLRALSRRAPAIGACRPESFAINGQTMPFLARSSPLWAVACFLVLLLGAGTVQGQSLQNGSFENDSTGWTLSGSVRIKPSAASDGVSAAQFNFGQLETSGLVAQTVTTIPGNSYTLNFDVGAASLVNQSEQRIHVTALGANNALLLSKIISVFAPGNGFSYTPQSASFVANGVSATLIFDDVSPTSIDTDLLLDNVRLTTQGGSKPVIATPPASATVQAGGSATFSVVASGASPLSYQWRFNGANITGAAASTYTISSAQISSAGSYDVLVTNSVGSALSSAAVLTVSAPSGPSALSNGSFENGYAGWTFTGNQDVVSDIFYAFTDGGKAVAFNVGQHSQRCSVADYRHDGGAKLCARFRSGRILHREPGRTTAAINGQGERQRHARCQDHLGLRPWQRHHLQAAERRVRSRRSHRHGGVPGYISNNAQCGPDAR